GIAYHTDLFYPVGWQHCIAVDRMPLKALCLNFSGPNHPFPDDFTRLRLAAGGHLIKAYRNDLHMKVDTVQQRTADFAKVTLYNPRTTNAFLVRVVIVSAGTRIHAGYQHEVSRVVDRHLGARYGHPAFLHRLSHHLQHTAFEFGEFVEEQHTIV